MHRPMCNKCEFFKHVLRMHFFLRILTGKKTLKENSYAYEKYEYGHLGRFLD